MTYFVPADAQARKSPRAIRMRAFLRHGLIALTLLLPTFAIASSTPDQSSTWIPSGIEQLGKTAAFHTDFTFDRTTLQMASGLIDDGDADTRRAIAKLDGVSVHLYRYAAPGQYDPRQLDVIRQQYKDAGWKHLVSKQSQPGTAGPAPSTPGPVNSGPGPAPSGEHTDLYIKFQGTDVVGMVVVQTTPRNLNVVAINGDISPIDLLHLRGHFGIPKFAGDGFTPADN
jgi:hypothetical protein